MSEDINPTAYQALEKALEAVRDHKKSEAHRLALQAAKLAPDWDAPWIVLASLSDPETSLLCLKKALEINPSSERARQGMHWAVRRYRRKIASQALTLPPEETQKISTENSPASVDSPPAGTNAAAVWMELQRRQAQLHPPAKKPSFRWVPVLLGVSLLCLVVLAAYMIFPQNILAAANKPQGAYQAAALVKPSLTPTNTATSTFTPTPTATSTPTSTFTPTSTQTPQPTITKQQPLPTFTSQSVDFYFDQGPVDPPTSGRWIDINLTYQTLYAYKGSKLINAFVVSTGTYLHPTVTGQYAIYVKYDYDDMIGPDYYLPDVPYTMYFYEGYGIHGTYWHSNFGTPMSHGCINMRTSEAAWLYGWAPVGTIVNIHY